MTVVSSSVNQSSLGQGAVEQSAQSENWPSCQTDPIKLTCMYAGWSLPVKQTLLKHTWSHILKNLHPRNDCSKIASLLNGVWRDVNLALKAHTTSCDRGLAVSKTGEVTARSKQLKSFRVYQVKSSAPCWQVRVHRSKVGPLPMELRAWLCNPQEMVSVCVCVRVCVCVCVCVCVRQRER